jgi:hypothetical protein
MASIHARREKVETTENGAKVRTYQPSSEWKYYAEVRIPGWLYRLLAKLPLPPAV